MVAAALNCTGRTLNRALAKEVALLAGFSDARALRRFFKAQTSQTLKQFRANAMLS